GREAQESRLSFLHRDLRGGRIPRDRKGPPRMDAGDERRHPGRTATRGRPRQISRKATRCLTDQLRENPYPTRVLARATASALWRHPNDHALHVLAGCDLDLGEPEHHARLGRTVDRRRPADGLQPDRPARYPTEREPAPRVGVRADPAGRSVLVL